MYVQFNLHIICGNQYIPHLKNLCYSNEKYILYPYLHLFTPICFGYQYIYLFMLLNISYLLQCIELYTNQDGDQNIGFYSLEMASDLELDPKQYHMIAFEDAGDCKNMCYIIQSHLEMLGNGNAFVIAQQPKVRIDP